MVIQTIKLTHVLKIEIVIQQEKYGNSYKLQDVSMIIGVLSPLSVHLMITYLLCCETTPDEKRLPEMMKLLLEIFIFYIPLYENII